MDSVRKENHTDLLFDALDNGICIAIKQKHERCENPAHKGFSTCGIGYHRQQEEQFMAEEENGYEVTPQTPGSSPKMTEWANPFSTERGILRGSGLKGSKLSQLPAESDVSYPRVDSRDSPSSAVLFPQNP